MERSRLANQIENYVIENKERFYRLAFSYVKNAEDALDIVQESIYKALFTMDTLKTPGYIKTWFYKIVVNTSIDLLRKRKKLVFIDDETIFEASVVDNYEDVEIKNLLEALPVQYRSIVVLRFFEDFKIEEIAEVLDENVNTIKTRLYKSLEMLRIKMVE